MRRLPLVVACWLIGAATSPAWAQTSTSAAAEAAFQEGRALLEQGQLDAACSKFLESQGLEASTGTLLAVADCHERQGKLATAWEQFSDVVWQAQQAGREDRAAFAAEAAAALEPRLSALTLEIGAELAAIPGLTVSLDGRVVESKRYNQPLFVDGGEHTVEISAPGYVKETRSSLVRSERHRVSLPVPMLQRSAPNGIASTPAEAVAPSAQVPVSAAGMPPASELARSISFEPDTRPGAAVDTGSSRTQSWGVTLGIAGLASTAIGGALLTGALLKKNASVDHCTGRYCDPEGLALRHDAVTLGRWATAFGVGGLLLGGTGIALYAFGGQNAEALGTSVSVMAQPDGAHASLQGSF